MSDPILPVGKYCEALRTWARLATKAVRNTSGDTIITEEIHDRVMIGITKSCLLKRLIYMGEELRTRQCPIHLGKWSGCYVDRCPAGCDTCGCASGWLPNDAPAFEAFGWTFWLAHAIDDAHKLPGMPPAMMMRRMA